MHILAIESSCDDTSASVIANDHILSNVTATQEVHKEYGGVIPELASRVHQQNIVPVIDKALKDAGIQKKEIDAVAFTQGPGLLGSLLVGCSFAKALALSLDIPLITVNHMEAHIMAHFIEDPKPEYPFLCLTVSGGHTQIVKVSSPRQMDVLGTTRDDAAGEAFDKIGKYLGLSYPAGPIIDELAQKGNSVFTFSKPKIEGLGFSFSGLKTSVLYFLKAEIKKDPDFIQKNLQDICASVQSTIIEILIDKVEKACTQEGIKQIAVAGGVSANSGLRARLKLKADEHNWSLYIPRLEYCTDNAAMIAMAAHYKYLAGDFAPQTVKPMPRLGINAEVL